MPSSDYENWLNSNEQALVRRLQWLRQQPNGDIYHRASAFHDIVVHKAGSQIQLMFRDPTASYVMSRLDLNDPLRQVAAYTQALMLGLVWIPQPQRAYVLGLGGGRLPLILHHYFPEIEIESTELDPVVVEVAERFFGLKPDERLRVIVQDGREYLETLKPQQGNYDLIMLDAFRGTGYGPYRLATVEFYQLCRRQLSPQGVVLVSLLDIDPLYQAKIFTFSRAFEQVYFCFYQDATVLIGTNRSGLELDQAEIITRAEALQEFYRFRVHLVAIAGKVFDSVEVQNYLAELPIQAQVLLEDAHLPPDYLEQISAASTIFRKARSFESCPCGSGKKYKSCHGRQP